MFHVSPFQLEVTTDAHDDKFAVRYLTVTLSDGANFSTRWRSNMQPISSGTKKATLFNPPPARMIDLSFDCPAESQSPGSYCRALDLRVTGIKDRQEQFLCRIACPIVASQDPRSVGMGYECRKDLRGELGRHENAEISYHDQAKFCCMTNEVGNVNDDEGYIPKCTRQ